MALSKAVRRSIPSLFFAYSSFKPVIRYKACPVQLSYKLAENDKQKMAEAVHAKQLATEASATDEPLEEISANLLQSQNASEGWTSFDERIHYIYAGKGPYVAR
jgi:sphingosine kinase